MNKDDLSLIILDCVIKGVWCSKVGGQIALETASKDENGEYPLRYLEKVTKSMTDIKYFQGDVVANFLESFLGKVDSMEEANLLWYGTHVQVAVEMSSAVDEIVPRPLAIINPDTKEFVLNYNEFYPYGLQQVVLDYKVTPRGEVKPMVKLVDKYYRFLEYLKRKYNISDEELIGIIAEKLQNPTYEADLEASEEFYRRSSR